METVLDHIIDIRHKFIADHSENPNYIMMGVQEYSFLVAEMHKNADIKEGVEYKIYGMKIIVVTDLDYIEVGRGRFVQ